MGGLIAIVGGTLLVSAPHSQPPAFRTSLSVRERDPRARGVAAVPPAAPEV